jgi:FkbM family methyltransferase
MLQDHEFPLRPGTNDAVVFDAVVIRNEYRLRDRLAPGAIVVDIGVHVGAFSYLALSRGAAEVHGFEPDRSNYLQAVANLAPFGRRVHLQNRAVWRSDVPSTPLHFWPSSDAANTAGGTLIWDTDGPLVDTIAFDAAVDAIAADRRIALMKMDCEGSQFPVLLTSKRLHRIDRIVGEYHELRARLPAHVRVAGVEEFSLDLLVSALQQAGFTVTAERQATATYGDLGLFFAERTKIAPPG